MATAVGSYVTTAGAKLRLLDAGVTDSSNDALISALCDEVNQFIEGRTGRVLSPVPAYSSTFTGTAGQQSITVAGATGLPGLAVGDDLLLGPISGTHEDATVMAVSGATAWLVSPLEASYPSPAPLQRIYVQDGHGALDDGRRLVVARGLIMLAALEVAPYSGGPFALGSQADYFLRPSGPDLEPGWPFTEIVWTDVPTGSPYPVFYPGYGNIRLIGPGPCVDPAMPSLPFAGWPAVPDDVKGVAEALFLAAFRERASSGGDTMTVSLDGTRVYERALSHEQKRTLERYRVKSAQAV
jgi:hypothetical protein